LAGQGSERILKTDADILATEAMDGLIALISAYANIAVGYRSRLRPQFINFDGEYDHLARYGEWRDGAVP
jgi:RecB family exonuclease